MYSVELKLPSELNTYDLPLIRLIKSLLDSVADIPDEISIVDDCLLLDLINIFAFLSLSLSSIYIIFDPSLLIVKFLSCREYIFCS